MILMTLSKVEAERLARAIIENHDRLDLFEIEEAPETGRLQAYVYDTTNQRRVAGLIRRRATAS